MSAIYDDQGRLVGVGETGPQGDPGPPLADGDYGDVTISSSGTDFAIVDEAVVASNLAASTTNVLFGRSTAGAGPGEEIDCSAAGRAILDDANAAAQRTTLGVPAGSGTSTGTNTGDQNLSGYQLLSEKGAASGYASLNGSTKVVENPASATATPTATSIPIADGSGKLAIAWLSEVLALANLSDVSGKTGTGSTVVMATGATLNKPTIGDAGGTPIIATPSLALTLPVNYLLASNAETAGPPTLTAQGTDTDISINLIPKGTGRLLEDGVAVILEGDARLSDDRTPTAHAASHKSGGGDELALDELAVPGGPVDFDQQEAQAFVIENRTSDPGSPVAGQIWLRTDL